MKRRAGFTLAEVVVASLLVAIIFSAVLRSFSYAGRTAAHVECRLACAQFAREVMERLKVKAFNDASLNPGSNKRFTANPDKNEVNAGLSQLIASSNKLIDADYNFSVAYAPGGNNQIKDITVVVVWDETTGARHSLSITSSMGMALHK